MAGNSTKTTQQRARGGRRESKKTKNKAALLKALEESGGNVTKACLAASLDRSTFYTYLNDKKFAQAVDEICERLKDEGEDVLREVMLESSDDKARIRAAEIWLKARAKDRGYGIEKREQEHSGEVNTGQTVIVRLPDNGRRTYDQPKD